MRATWKTKKVYDITKRLQRNMRDSGFVCKIMNLASLCNGLPALEVKYRDKSFLYDSAPVCPSLSTQSKTFSFRCEVDLAFSRGVDGVGLRRGGFL